MGQDGVNLGAGVQTGRSHNRPPTCAGSWRPLAMAIGVLLVFCNPLLGQQRRGGQWTARPGAEREADTDDDRGESGKVEEIFQELFLGEIVYPQDRGEIQLTTAVLWGHDGPRDVRIPIIFEYGITDRFQVAAIIPINFSSSGEDPARITGNVEYMGNVELDAYWSFLNDAKTGRAAGIGFAVGLPIDTEETIEKAYVYEPYLILYQASDLLNVNFTANLEVENFVEAGEETEVNGALGVALFKQYKPYAYILELGVDIEKDRTPVRLAPGAYYHWPDSIWEFGVSLPIGLNSDAPDFGFFAVLTFEFDDEGGRYGGRRGDD